MRVRKQCIPGHFPGGVGTRLPFVASFVYSIFVPKINQRSEDPSTIQQPSTSFTSDHRSNKYQLSDGRSSNQQLIYNSALPPLSSDPVRFHHDTNTCPEYLMCTEEEVMDIIWRLDVSKASGPDQISVRILKGTVGSISPKLAGLFNKMIKHGKISSVWKI